MASRRRVETILKTTHRSDSSLESMVLSAASLEQLGAITAAILRDAEGGPGTPPALVVDARKLINAGLQRAVPPEALDEADRLMKMPLKSRVMAHMRTAHAKALATGSPAEALDALKAEVLAQELAKSMQDVGGSYTITLKTAGGEDVTLRPNQQPVTVSDVTAPRQLPPAIVATPTPVKPTF